MSDYQVFTDAAADVVAENICTVPAGTFAANSQINDENPLKRI